MSALEGFLKRVLVDGIAAADVDKKSPFLHFKETGFRIQSLRSRRVRKTGDDHISPGKDIPQQSKSSHFIRFWDKVGRAPSDTNDVSSHGFCNAAEMAANIAKTNDSDRRSAKRIHRTGVFPAMRLTLIIISRKALHEKKDRCQDMFTDGNPIGPCSIGKSHTVWQDSRLAVGIGSC